MNSHQSLYSFASLGGVECALFRLRGVGLANCLFPWARCRVASRQHDLRQLASTWPQLCHRQWLRFDRDKRTYANLFDESDVAIGGLQRLKLLATSRRIPEREFLENPGSARHGIVVFSGIENYFAEMLQDAIFLRNALVQCTRKEHMPSIVAPGICVHVRYGDATHVEPGRPVPDIPHWHLRQPVEWYVRMVQELRSVLAQSVPVWVFSDASDEEIRPLLAIQGVRRVFFGSAVADLHAMSTAKVLVASGSTFSMWAAFLGRMPVIWPPNNRRQQLHGANWEYEIELDGSLPDRVVELVRKQMNASATPEYFANA